MPHSTKYNSTTLKTKLKRAVTRIQEFNNKKSALTKQQIREIATLLAETPPREEMARIKAEALIRDDSIVEACEIIASSCRLLSERISLVTHSRDCPPDLISSVSTIIWASAVLDIPVLTEIRTQFRLKWGKKFEMNAMQNVGGVINERVAAKLSVQPPSAYLVQLYLERIADQHQVTMSLRTSSDGNALFASALDADDHEEEVDIYVPAYDAGTINQTMASRGRTQSAGEAYIGFDASDHRGDGTASTVEEMAARFANLKR
ncbi:hypothetical protein ACHAWX_000864 [Stephanocyclus meneghinianus]